MELTRSALTTVPAVLYLVIEMAILRGNTTVMGSRYAADCHVGHISGREALTDDHSMWVFLLLGIEAVRTYKQNPYLIIGTHHIPTWTTPLLLILVVAALIPNTSLLGHLCGVGVGYIGMHRSNSSEPIVANMGCLPAGLGYVKYVAPPEWALRWIESRLNLLAILPHYVSVDQKTYGRFGVLPSSNRTGGSAPTELMGTTQRLGP